MEIRKLFVLNTPIEAHIHEICDMMEMRIMYKGEEESKLETIVDIFRLGKEFAFVSILGTSGYNLQNFIANHLFYRFTLDAISRIDYVEIKRCSLTNIENKSYDNWDMYCGMRLD